MALLPSNQRDQIMVVVCVLALGLAGAYYMYLWSPKNEQLTTLQARVDTLVAQNEISQRSVASGTAAKLRAEADEYGRMLGVMRQLVPVANEVPTLIDQVSTAAREAGLDIGDISPLGVINGDVFDTYRYKMSVSGPYHRIGRFLSNVGSLTRIIAPMNLSLLPTARDTKTMRVRPKEAILDASFEIQTYVAKTSAPPPAAAGAASTATKGR
ncbi:MAG TPA: type 4a pilus biogenesis protein PilO [Gemmatimonadaceae bacterium]|nr:type 4a pilus biogenesis protein PilO [Gemmatimonadaceae bacterium]